MDPKHLGSDFDDFLREEGMLEHADEVAARREELRRRLAGREPVHLSEAPADILREEREKR
jgi:hypothetical protein